MLLALAAPALAAGPDPGPPPWRVGGRVGFTVDAVSFPDSAGTTLDVYVRVPPATLAGLARDAGGQGRLRLDARLRGPGGPPAERNEEFEIQPNDSTAGYGRVVAFRFPVRPGGHRLEVRMDDVLSRKRGLIYAGRNVTESGRVEGAIRVPPRPEGRGVSEIEFVWAALSADAPGSFERGGRTLLPNPERLYGLFAPQVRAAFVGTAPVAQPWRWTARVLDAGGKTIVEARDSTGAPAARLDGSVQVDVKGLPAGDYDLDLLVQQPGPAAPIERKARFSVAWQIGAWLRNPRDIEDDVHFLLNPDQEEDFAALSPGAQERVLEDFWAQRDPSPGLPGNEARATFLKRVEHANEHWSRPGLGKGMFSDMGRVYVRYGEPSEVMNQVMPGGDETVDLAISQIRASETRPTGDLTEKGPGADQRPYEIWIYDPPIPPPFDADPKVAQRGVRQKRLLFFFVDEHGLGDYRLRYSTE